jgi:hypothetical protein
MMNQITTKFGKQLDIDLSEWKIDQDSRKCKVIEISEGDLLLENKYEDRFSLPEYLINANELNIVDNIVELPKGLYDHYFLKKYRAKSMKLFNTYYHKYASLIFQNRSVVLNKAEYYLLKPERLSTGFMYTGGIYFSIGKLFESFESGNHIYYDEFCGYRRMYLVSLVASMLSGTIFSATFWSDETNEFVSFTSQKYDSKPKLPGDFTTAHGRTLMKMLSGTEMMIDRQDKAIINLINEINGK